MIKTTSFLAAGLLALLACPLAHAGPAGTAGTIGAAERPYTFSEVETNAKLATFGLCTAPQNADDLPTNPVPIEEDNCNAFQKFESTSNGPSNGGSCGGHTVAFGPMGDLKLDWKRYYLRAYWGEQPLTQAQCPKARLAAVAWGARCMNADCSTTQWEKIGNGFQSKKGVWSTNSNRCVLEHYFSNGQHHYKTLNIDVIATLQEGSQTVRKRAKATIRAEKGNGKCFSTDVQAREPSVRAADKAGATHQPR
jgi:hypothetical protein